MTTPYPLRFQPILWRYIWGGRRLHTLLHKPIGLGDDWAESWEICDLGASQSVVTAGAWAGCTLHQLMEQHGRDLLGKHYPQPIFPLMLKFLDASHNLSVQVHPDNVHAAQRTPPQLGKTEAWVVIEAAPESQLYLGLKQGISKEYFAKSIQRGDCQDCLNVLHPSPGDCYYLPAGTIHALGEGVLVIEIQQPSDLTYRLFDWNRMGLDGLPRTLHVKEGLEVADFIHGPITAQHPRSTHRHEVSRLIECDHFTVDRWAFDTALSLEQDDRCHILTVLDGKVEVEGDPAQKPLIKGETILLPAAVTPTLLTPLVPSVLLDFYLP